MNVRSLVQLLRRSWNDRTTAGDGPGRRRLIASLLLGPGAAWAAGADKPAAGAPLTRIRLHNTGRAVQEAGFVSPMFGLPLRQGDIPAGRQPQFSLPDGRPCPATLWAQTSWPDGSLKFCGAMVRVPADIPARGTLELLVRPTEAASAPSKRRLDELSSAGLAVELTGVEGLEGVWTAELASGIRERTAAVKIGDGAAGAVWRIGTDFRDSRGNAHGQLYCWHYVAALQDEAAGLQGLRYLGRVAQPWTDVSTPPARHRDVQARLLAGKAELRRLQGHVDTEKPGPVIRLPHYASFFTADTDARWDFVQGGGSASTDASVRVSLDPAYWIDTRLVPPYDRRVYIGAAPNATYFPMGAGSVTRGMGNTGERADIGVLPEWNVCHLLSQAADHERLARVNALVAGGWRLCMRKRATLQPVPSLDDRPRYAGLGPAEPAWRGYLHMAGIARPQPNDSLWHEDGAHRPGCVYWPYLFSGEPQYLDLLTEHAFTHVLELHQGTNTYAVTPPIRELYVGGWRGGRDVRIGTQGRVYRGAGVMFNGEGGMRIVAWTSRDVAQAAALCPQDAPDGAAVRDYLVGVMQESYAALAEYARRMPNSFAQAGLFALRAANDSPWMNGYLSWSICHQADILATRESAQAREYLSRMWRAFAAVGDIGCLTAYRFSLWNEDRMVQRIEEVVSLRQGTIDFGAADGRGTIRTDGRGEAFAWAPSDGDVFVFGAPEASPLLPTPAVRPGQRLYAINCERTSFQLSTKPGGDPLTIPKDLTIPSYMCRAKDLRPALGFRGGPHNYQSNISGAVSYHLARGDDVGQAKAALDIIVVSQNTRFDNHPKYLVV